MQTIGEKVRIQRMIKGYSQEYMAFMLDISQAAYSNLERNETDMTIRRVFEIAEILEISPYQLMPKPKFGTGMNYFHIAATIRKIAKIWQPGVNARRKRMPAI